VIQRSATIPSVDAEAENNRPAPPGISAEGTGPLNEDEDRDARAYERERHRAKHAEEWAKRRAMKAITQATIDRPAGAGAGRRLKNSRSGKVDLDVDVYAVVPQKKDVEHTTATKMWDGLGAGLFKRASIPPSGGGIDTVQEVRVNLSELVALSQKKPRNRNGTVFRLVSFNDQIRQRNWRWFFFVLVDDFEVIPHIGSVIALDDVENVHDMDLDDESWEHIYPNDGEGKVCDGVGKLVEPSYARVVGTGCQWYSGYLNFFFLAE
jgi:hypothetical protein